MFVLTWTKQLTSLLLAVMVQSAGQNPHVLLRGVQHICAFCITCIPCSTVPFPLFLFWLKILVCEKGGAQY